MNIIWYGQNCFKLGLSGNKNGNSVELIVDPFEKEIGLRAPKIDESNIVLFSENQKPIPGVFSITGPGEYDIKGISIQGTEALTKDKEKTTIYVIEAEDIKICHLGLLGQKELTTKELEGIGDIDILMIPIGGEKTIDAKEALEIIAGKRQCMDNLMGNRDVAIAALSQYPGEGEKA